MADQKTLEMLLRENEALASRIRKLEEELESRTDGIRSPARPETILGLEVMILFVDAQCTIQYLNSSMARLLERDRDEVVGRPLREIDHLSWGPGLLLTLAEECRREGGAREVEARFFDARAKAMKYVIVRATPTDEGIQFVIEDRTNYKQLQQMFSRYVPPRVLDAMIAGGQDYVRAEQGDLSILFSDLRGFTAAARELPPASVKKLLDSHLAVMFDVISAEDGTIDKITGDGLMAFFGAPVAMKDHPVCALRTALKMQEAHRGLMEEWRAHGFPPLPMGIGINSGAVVVGMVGSRLRMEYTAIGHPVNVAARLCQAAGAGEILMSRETFSRVRQLLVDKQSQIDCPVKFRNGFKVKAKGLEEPVPTIVAFQVSGSAGRVDSIPRISTTV